MYTVNFSYRNEKFTTTGGQSFDTYIEAQDYFSTYAQLVQSAEKGWVYMREDGKRIMTLRNRFQESLGD